MLNLSSTLVLSFLMIINKSYGDEIIVSTEYGKLRGKSVEYSNGSVYFSFQGIPYASPPLGDLTFKPPVPPKPWTGIKDALKPGSPCSQLVNNVLLNTSSQDCLFLNVYTPEIPTNRNVTLKDVMFFIHGGYFFEGFSTDDYGPEYLLKDDIVLVTINYRLDIYGFMKTENSSLGIPGNAAMKDMIAALKWVRRNIAKFGGNPESVTVFGQSAGSVATHLLTLSPLTKGLINAAICESGSGGNYWSLSLNNSVVVLARSLGYDVDTEEAAVKFLRDASPQTVLRVRQEIGTSRGLDSRGTTGPVLEIESPDAFLTRQPIEIINEGLFNDIPIIGGFNDAEGILKLGPLDDIESWFPNTVEDIQGLLPRDLDVGLGTEKNKTAASEVRSFYFGKVNDTKSKINAFVYLQSDMIYIYGAHRAFTQQSKKAVSPIYLYRFAYDLSINRLKASRNLTGRVEGAAHEDEIGYLFPNKNQPVIVPNSPEDIGIRRLTKLWTDFAKTKNPTVSAPSSLLPIIWTPLSKNSTACSTNYYNLNEKLVNGKVLPECERLKFWDELYEKYGRKYITD